MMGVPYLIDSNVLLRWVKRDDRDYPIAVSAIDFMPKNNAVLCYTSQNVSEFWNTCTRPLERNGYALSIQETDQRARFFESRLRLLEDSIVVHQEWRQLLLAHRVSGVQVHDARIVATMRVHGVQHILTFNQKDFTRYSDIKAVHPSAASLEHP